MFDRDDKVTRRFEASIHGYEIRDDAAPGRRGPVRTGLKATHDRIVKKIRRGR